MSRARVLMTVAALLLAALAAVGASERPLATVGSIDLARYAGLWYEIANYPNRFQKICVRNTTAEYSVRDDGNVRVVNRCATGDGTSSVDGLARRVRDSTDKLEVSFLPALLRWLPIGWGDYWVIGLAPDYRYAVVGEPSRQYLWILSRTPTLSAEDRRAIDALLRERGYDPALLVATAQDPR